MANNKFNARHGLSVGATPVDVVDNLGEVLTNAASATKLKDSRTISLTGNITGSVSFDGTQNVSISTTLEASVNKTFTDNATFFQDNADNTKKMVFELSSISASATRVITVPDANLTLVGLDTTQTLTNKTLTSPSINGGAINNATIGATTASSGAFTSLAASSAVSFTANTASTNTTTGTVVVTGGVGISGSIHVGSDLVLTGNVTTGTWQGTIISPTYGGTGVNNGNRTITISTGNVSLTAAAAGSVITLPASGTVATLAGTETLTNKTIGAATISGDLIPDTDITHNLGSATKRFKDLFLSGTTINLGSASISSAGSSVTVSAIDNTPIGATTRSTGAFTTLTSNGATTFTADTESTSSSTGTVIVTGGVGISKNLYVGGNLVVNGITTTVNSTTVTVDDPIFTLGGDAAPTADDTKDRGIEFRWYDTQARIGFFGFDASSGKFTFIPNATNTAEVFSGTKGTLDANIEWADVLNKPDPSITVTLTGDVTGTASATLTDLASGTVTIATSVAANSVALGTDTTGNYLLDVSAGNGISVSHTQGEGSTATVSHADTSSVTNETAAVNTFVSGITFDTYGHVQSVSRSSPSGFLTAESDTLATVTGRGATTATASTFSGGVTVGLIKQSQTSINGNSATTTLDFNTSGNFYINLSTNTTLAFSNLSTNIGSSGYIFLKQDATGGRTFTFPTEAKTPGGRTFTQNTTANSLSLITFYVVDANTVIVNYMADFK
jgi:hypothetical protein